MDDGFKRPDSLVVKEKDVKDVEKATGGQVGNNGVDEVTRVETISSESVLPFSKARTIALVATVAAAPFLSVSYEHVGSAWHGLTHLNRQWLFKHRLSSCPPSAKLLTYLRVDSNGSFQHTILRLVAS